MAVTIRDVAKKLNLSITTVSRALDDYDDVAHTTRERVRSTARKMGYVPSRAARNLRRQRADIIGYVIPASGTRFTDPFFSEFIAGLGDQAVSHNFDLLISTATPDTEKEKQLYARWVSSRLVDGIILSRLRLEDWRVEYLQRNHVPFVMHGRTQSKTKFPFIEIDSRAGFALLVKHLVERGHRRIAYIGAPEKFTLQRDRYAGYQNGLSAANIPLDKTLVCQGDLTRAGGYHAAQSLFQLRKPPTAIIGANDLTAEGVLRAARERGIVVGRDLAVAGYDGTEVSEHTQPPLTTLRQPVYETARKLVTMLIALIQNEPLEPSQIILQPELIIRESTAG
ncbi:MAG: LacI family DNA-binding transcriptional regulator [Chloroflexi bacterium]|nr:LacI family DNA-binding transcriptional regulator [Chloroflexota bacterium]